MRMTKAVVIAMACAAIGAEVRLAGPVLGYVVDGDGGMRPIQGVLGAATVGEPVREGVRAVSGSVILSADGSAEAGGRMLEGNWEKLSQGVLADGAGLRILAAGAEEAKPILLSSRALSAAASRGAVAVLSEDGILRVFGVQGEARFQMETGVFWGFAFIPGTEALVAYDPAANELVRIEESGAVHGMRKLSGQATRFAVGIDAGTGAVALLDAENRRCVVVRGGEARELEAPAGAVLLESLSGSGLLLSADPGRPLWILDPSREEPFVAVPALRSGEAEVAQ